MQGNFEGSFVLEFSNWSQKGFEIIGSELKKSEFFNTMETNIDCASKRSSNTERVLTYQLEVAWSCETEMLFVDLQAVA